MQESFSATQSPLISAEKLVSMLDNPKLRVLDVRGRWTDPPTCSHDDYRQAHIPNAVLVD